MHELRLTGQAGKDILRLPADASTRIRAQVRMLAAEPRPPGSVKLASSGLFRVRVGDYRVIYEVDDSARVVTILRVRHRREAYRNV